MISFRMIATLTFTCWLPAIAMASASTCAGIENGVERLACFDEYFPNKSLTSNTISNISSIGKTKELKEPAEMISAVQMRLIAEQQADDNWFAILPHKQNYVLPATYNSSPDYVTDYGPVVGGFFSDSEIKFQLSLKTPLVKNLWRNSTVSAAYTQQSYWQLFADDEISAPFRETNHEPEIMWQVPVEFDLFGFSAQHATLAFNHQSNGRSQPLSRSWNRITGELLLAKDRFAISAKTWKRIEESENDDNPHIEDYMGRIQLGAAYKGDRHSLSLVIKSSLGSKVRNGVELGWTFPLAEHLKGFVQVYSGYGENLIDMENYNNRIGFGIALTDWL